MRTIEEIQSRIAEIDKIDRKTLSDSEEKKTGKLRSKLTLCLYYLQTEPKEEHISKSLEANNSMLDKISNGYSSWYDNTPGTEALKNPRSAYENEMGVKKLKEQIKVMKYLLGNANI